MCAICYLHLTVVRFGHELNWARNIFLLEFCMSFFVFRKYHSNKIWQHISYISWAFVCFSVCICFKVHLLTWQCLNSQCYYNTSISWTKHTIGPNQFTIQCFLNGNLLFLTLNICIHTFTKEVLKLRKLTPPIKMYFLKFPPLFWKIWHSH